MNSQTITMSLCQIHQTIHSKQLFSKRLTTIETHQRVISRIQTPNLIVILIRWIESKTVLTKCNLGDFSGSETLAHYTLLISHKTIITFLSLLHYTIKSNFSIQNIQIELIVIAIIGLQPWLKADYGVRPCHLKQNPIMVRNNICS